MAFLSVLPLAACGFIETDPEGTTIKEIAANRLENGDTEITITFADEDRDPVVFVIPKGEDGSDGQNGENGADGLPGENGQPGAGIQSIDQTVSADGNTLILTVTFTDGREPEIIEVPILNGKDGLSIESVTTKTDSLGNTVVTISFTGDLEDVSFTVPKGEQGNPGNGISGVTVEENSDGSQTVTISYTDASMKDTVLTIPAPKEGKEGVGVRYILSDETETEYILTFYLSDGTSQSVSFSKPTQPSTWLSGFSAPDESMGNDGDFYLNKADLTIYQKLNGTWMIIAQLSSSQETHTVRFDANGGTFSSDTFSTVFQVTHGETFYGNPKYIFPTVTYEGYTFLGWYTSVNQKNPTVGKFTDLTPVYSDMTLYAWWEASN